MFAYFEDCGLLQSCCFNKYRCYVLMEWTSFNLEPLPDIWHVKLICTVIQTRRQPSTSHLQYSFIYSVIHAFIHLLHQSSTQYIRWRSRVWHWVQTSTRLHRTTEPKVVAKNGKKPRQWAVAFIHEYASCPSAAAAAVSAARAATVCCVHLSFGQRCYQDHVTQDQGKTKTTSVKTKTKTKTAITINLKITGWNRKADNEKWVRM